MEKENDCCELMLVTVDEERLILGHCLVSCFTSCMVCLGIQSRMINRDGLGMLDKDDADWINLCDSAG